jgi:hypothetical protein
VLAEHERTGRPATTPTEDTEPSRWRRAPRPGWGAP